MRFTWKYSLFRFIEIFPIRDGRHIFNLYFCFYFNSAYNILLTAESKIISAKLWWAMSLLAVIYK